jgi:hypothetical protein
MDLLTDFSFADWQKRMRLSYPSATFALNPPEQR